MAVIGNVDSGKSTFVGVLTRTILDDGRGLARSKVGSHIHTHRQTHIHTQFMSFLCPSSSLM